MKYGVNTFIWTDTFTADHLSLLPRIKEAGFDGIEVSYFGPEAFQGPVLRRGLEAHGLEATICAVLPGDLSVFTADSALRAATLAHLTECVKRVAEVGIKLIAGPLYSRVGYLPGRRRTDDEWRRAVEFYQEFGPVLAANGVTMAIEPLNRFETFFLNTAADAAALCDAVNHPNIGILFDTFHANIEEKDVADGYRTVARHLKHVHTCENDRGTPGSGHVPWPGVFNALREIGYDGWLTIESFGFAIPGLTAAAAIWRDLASSPDVIAFEGVKFLKSGMGKGVSA
jgi:D-psicose/D-tagatose/L-ribulose 3-epimerase